jgi:hypothetical protein
MKNDFEYFENNNIEFIDKNKLTEIIINDNFLKTLTKYDLIARKVNNINEYKNIIKKSSIDIKKKYQNTLIKAIKIADSKCYLIHQPWFDGSKLKNIRWKIGCINSDKYENGLPHTIQNIIVLNVNILDNNINHLAKTLLHEKMHIYQKIYISDIEKYLEYYGFTKSCKRNKIKLLRANPDVNEWVYKDYKNKNLTGIYNSKNPKNIMDVYFTPKNKVIY